MIERLQLHLGRFLLAAGTLALLVALLKGLPVSTAVGCAVGFLIGREPLPDLWFLLTHRLGGIRLALISYGRGRRLWRGTIAGVPFEVGRRPTSGLFLPWCLLPSRTPRLRLWLVSTGQAVLHAGLGFWLATSCTGPTRGIGFGLLFTFGLLALTSGRSLVNSLWPVFVLPFAGPEALGGDLWTPHGFEAERLLLQGRIREARGRLEEAPIAPREAVTAAATVLAQGRYQGAEELARAALEHDWHNTNAHSFLGLAIVGQVDCGELSPERGVARLGPALAAFGQNDRAVLRSVLPAADLARFAGDPEAAVRAARRLRSGYRVSLWIALAECSLAAALIAAARAEEARKALARARRECPELARIADVERLLEYESTPVRVPR
ncbi:type IV pilus biogenesis/stability protein PilW [Kitasatospora indigofera]|uniref:tetratricopeptide repeat protein n=1 Tax=Kitasatospora indigofera TaxID=67307 RepID=UPI00368B8D09